MKQSWVSTSKHIFILSFIQDALFRSSMSFIGATTTINKIQRNALMKIIFESDL